MRIPIANEIQEKLNNGEVLTGINWFRWSLFGLEFTYFTAPNERWNASNLHNIERTDFSEDEYARGYIIDDKFMQCSPAPFFKTFGIPLKGNGYVCGLSFHRDGVYYDFIYESEYFAHVNVKMNPAGEFDGNIIVPPTWDLAKREKILLSSAKNVNIVCADILERVA